MAIFDEVIEGFDDQLVIGKSARKFNPLDAEEQARSGDRFWVPMPQIGASFDGFDQTSNFGDLTELSVPVSIGYHKVVPQKFSAKDLRVESSLRNRGKAARQKLARTSTTRCSTPLPFRAACSSSAPARDRLRRRVAGRCGADRGRRSQRRPRHVPRAARCERDGRQPGIPLLPHRRNLNAYEKAMVNVDIAGFEVFKNDQSIRLAAATGGATTVNGANQYLEPSRLLTAATGEVSNVDNRYSNLTITAATYANIKVGDAFTIAGVNSVNMITKQDTGQLQTFRVIGKPSAGVIQIAPAIISNGGSTRAGQEYQNVTPLPANGAALTWLNTTAAELNPFFVRELALLVPRHLRGQSGGRLAGHAATHRPRASASPTRARARSTISQRQGSLGSRFRHVAAQSAVRRRRDVLAAVNLWTGVIEMAKSTESDSANRPQRLRRSRRRRRPKRQRLEPSAPASRPRAGDVQKARNEGVTEAIKEDAKGGVRYRHRRPASGRASRSSPVHRRGRAHQHDLRNAGVRSGRAQGGCRKGGLGAFRGASGEPARPRAQWPEPDPPRQDPVRSARRQVAARSAARRRPRLHQRRIEHHTRHPPRRVILMGRGASLSGRPVPLTERGTEMSEFPKMVYRKGGDEEIFGLACDTQDLDTLQRERVGLTEELNREREAHETTKAKLAETEAMLAEATKPPAKAKETLSVKGS
jgi:hypothetical protein